MKKTTEKWKPPSEWENTCSLHTKAAVNEGRNYCDELKGNAEKISDIDFMLGMKFLV